MDCEPTYEPFRCDSKGRFGIELIAESPDGVASLDDIDPYPLCEEDFRTCTTAPVIPPMVEEIEDIFKLTLEDSRSLYFLNHPAFVRILPLLRDPSRINRASVIWLQLIVNRLEPVLQAFARCYNAVPKTELQQRIIAAVIRFGRLVGPEASAICNQILPPELAVSELPPADIPRSFTFSWVKEFPMFATPEPFLFDEESFTALYQPPTSQLFELAPYLGYTDDQVSQNIHPPQLAQLFARAFPAIYQLVPRLTPADAPPLGKVVLNSLRRLLNGIPSKIRNPRVDGVVPPIDPAHASIVARNFQFPSGPFEECDVHAQAPFALLSVSDVVDPLTEVWEDFIADAPDNHPARRLAPTPPLQPSRPRTPLTPTFNQLHAADDLLSPQSPDSQDSLSEVLDFPPHPKTWSGQDLFHFSPEATAVPPSPPSASAATRSKRVLMDGFEPLPKPPGKRQGGADVAPHLDRSSPSPGPPIVALQVEDPGTPAPSRKRKRSTARDADPGLRKLPPRKASEKARAAQPPTSRKGKGKDKSMSRPQINLTSSAKSISVDSDEGEPEVDEIDPPVSVPAPRSRPHSRRVRHPSDGAHDARFPPTTGHKKGRGPKKDATPFVPAVPVPKLNVAGVAVEATIASEGVIFAIGCTNCVTRRRNCPHKFNLGTRCDECKAKGDSWCSHAATAAEHLELMNNLEPYTRTADANTNNIISTLGTARLLYENAQRTMFSAALFLTETGHLAAEQLRRQEQLGPGGIPGLDDVPEGLRGVWPAFVHDAIATLDAPYQSNREVVLDEARDRIVADHPESERLLDHALHAYKRHNALRSQLQGPADDSDDSGPHSPVAGPSNHPSAIRMDIDDPVQDDLRSVTLPDVLRPAAGKYSAYLRAPTSGYAHAVAPQQFVHLVLDLALDPPCARRAHGRREGTLAADPPPPHLHPRSASFRAPAHSHSFRGDNNNNNANSNALANSSLSSANAVPNVIPTLSSSVAPAPAPAHSSGSSFHLNSASDVPHGHTPLPLQRPPSTDPGLPTTVAPPGAFRQASPFHQGTAPFQQPNAGIFPSGSSFPSSSNGFSAPFSSGSGSRLSTGHGTAPGKLAATAAAAAATPVDDSPFSFSPPEQPASFGFSAGGGTHASARSAAPMGRMARIQTTATAAAGGTTQSTAASPVPRAAASPSWSSVTTTALPHSAPPCPAPAYHPPYFEAGLQSASVSGSESGTMTAATSAVRVRGGEWWGWGWGRRGRRSEVRALAGGEPCELWELFEL
ncbi:hypothetical protein C8R47DRAFT_1303726 [Mycena vitilis]|nr:hypothetical protein C8R47DRAFT_1303726 [Mycena vitilis]